MNLPEKWPPSERPSIQRQSEIIQKVDSLIEKVDLQRKKLLHLRRILLLGWRLSHDHHKYFEILRDKGPYDTTPLLVVWANRQWRKIKEWRSKQP